MTKPSGPFQFENIIWGWGVGARPFLPSPRRPVATPPKKAKTDLKKIIGGNGFWYRYYLISKTNF